MTGRSERMQLVYPGSLGRPGVLDRTAGARPAGDASASASAQYEAPRTIHFVLPAYNEAGGLEHLLERIDAAMGASSARYHAYVVDDGSDDATADVARAVGRRLPVTLLCNRTNLGLGGSLHRGLLFAAQSAAPDDVIVTMDADCTHDPATVPAMVLAYQAGNEVVIASRFRPGSVVVGVSSFRKSLTLGARLFSGSLLPAPGVRDYSCGFRLYRAELLQDAFARWGDGLIRERGFGCMVEVLTKLRGSARFAEVPFTLRYDEKVSPSAMRVYSTIAAYGRVALRARLERPGSGDWTTSLSTAFSILLVLVVVLLGVAGQLLLKAGVSGSAGVAEAAGSVERASGLGATAGRWEALSSFAGVVSAALFEPAVLVGFVCFAASILLWLAVLQRVDLAMAYPLGALSYLFIVGGGAAMGETVPLLRWIGVGVIMGGVALVGLGGVSTGSVGGSEEGPTGGPEADANA